MSNDVLVKAFGKINDDLIEDAYIEKASRKQFDFRKWIAIAACFLLIIGSAVAVDATSGAVSNLLAPLFGMTHTEIVDKIGVPIGASSSADGYTLTADAVIGDRYNMAVVYTLSRDNGEPIPEGIHFATWDTDVIWGATGAGSLKAVQDTDDPSKLYFIESWSRESGLIGRYVSVRFSRLEIYVENGDDIVVAEGPWQLNYTLRYEDTSVKIPVNKLSVTASNGVKYRIDKASISPVGIRLDGVILNPQWREEPPFRNFEVSLKLKDGTVVFLEDRNSGGEYSEGDKSASFNFNAMFDVPVDLENVTALVICGTEHQIDLTTK